MTYSFEVSPPNIGVIVESNLCGLAKIVLCYDSAHCATCQQDNTTCGTSLWYRLAIQKFNELNFNLISDLSLLNY